MTRPPFLHEPGPNQPDDSVLPVSKEEYASLLQLKIEMEASSQLRALSEELDSRGRPLLDSNDRYQITALHTLVARNQFVLMSSIASQVARPDVEIAYGRAYDPAPTRKFIFDGFNASKDHLIKAHAIYATQGYRVDDNNARTLRADISKREWPHAAQVSSAFLKGGYEALGMLHGYAQYQVAQILADERLPARFKGFLSQLLLTGLAEVEAHYTSMGRTSGSWEAFNANSETTRRTLCTDLQNGISTLDHLAVLTTFPRAFKKILRPPNPLIELRVGEVPFDASVLGQTAIGATPVPEKPTRPVRPGQPFDPTILKPPAVDKQETVEQPTANKTAGKENRPFDPTLVAPPRKPQPFDPSILQPKSNVEDTQDSSD
jgi:hypothetical protein